MRILVLLSDAFGGFGGIAKFNRDLLKALCSFSEVEEVVAIPRKASETIGELPSKLVYITEALNHKGKYLLTIFKVLYRKSDFDLILCGHIHLLFLAFLVKSLLGKGQLVLMAHGIEVWRPRHFLTRWAAGQVNVLISVSRFTENQFQKWASLRKARPFLLPNSVDLDQFKPGAKRSDLMNRYGLEGKKIIMTLARLNASERYKGIDEVLEALPALISEIPDILYLIVGDGTDRKRFERKVQSLNLNKQVIFAGQISEAEKVDYYRLADVFVMPGRGEGFGIVYLEALASGIPVIGSKRDASRETLCEGELGILVDPDNPKEIQSAIKEAFNKPRNDVSQKLRIFSTDHFNESLHQILNEVAGRN
ncbi:MAG: glycosyltransferase family 4 protein [Candidatus Omnitrophica bacterium]|nr:glycosyltransferase family 4 protein [Candidatus Omnitrophota bacterium]